MEHLLALLQRLAQSYLQLGAIRSANPRLTAIFQDEFELAVRDGLELKYAVDIDDRRSMNADETHGVEAICEFIQERRDRGIPCLRRAGSHRRLHPRSSQCPPHE